MRKVVKYIISWFISLFRVWRREFYLVTHDAGVMLFFVALPLFYPVAYTLIYNPELVEEVPKDKLTKREKYWITFYDSKNYGLNERNG